MSGEVGLWLNKYRVRSSLVLGYSLYLLGDIQAWSKLFASTSNLPGLEIAAILAAAQAPAFLLVGWAFKVFQETKTL
jgi:hypothetical protein